MTVMYDTKWIFEWMWRVKCWKEKNAPTLQNDKRKQ